MFTFSRLPPDLWSSVLGQLKPTESIELLKVTKGLRSLILHDGPFQKRADRLKICLIEIHSEEEDGRGSVRITQIAIDLMYDTLDEGVLEIDASFPFSLLSSDLVMQNQGGPQLQHENGWLLVRLTRSCRHLEILNHSTGRRTVPEWRRFFDRWLFLPQIRQIADLSLASLGNGQAGHLLMILERLEPFVTESIRFQLQDLRPTETMSCLEELLERPNFRQVNSLQAKRFLTYRDEIPLEEYWRLFSGNKNVDTVIFTHDSFDHFLETLDRFLKDGLPRGPKITSAALIVSIWIRDLNTLPNIRYYQRIGKKIDDLRPIKIKNVSDQANQIEEAFNVKLKKNPELFNFYKRGSTFYEPSGWSPLIVTRNYDKKRFFELRELGLFGMCTTERTVNKNKTVFENLQVWLPSKEKWLMD